MYDPNHYGWFVVMWQEHDEEPEEYFLGPFVEWYATEKEAREEAEYYRRSDGKIEWYARIYKDTELPGEFK